MTHPPVRPLLAAGLSLGLLFQPPATAAPASPAVPATPAVPAPPAASPSPSAVLRPQSVAPLPGGLDTVPMLNDNNPELIRGPGILLSTFAPGRGWRGQPLGVPAAHLDAPQQGPFELFSHHVYAGKKDRLDSTLWLAVLAAPRGDRPVQLRVRGGSTALSQAVEPDQAAAPFLPLPTLLSQGSSAIWSGPGSRVATELLRRERSPLLPESWTLPPGQLTPLLLLPLPVRGLDPLLNGRNLQLRLDSDGPVDVATLAAFGEARTPPAASAWAALLNGPLAEKEHAPSPKGGSGPVIYSRVSGVQSGSAWRGRITDPGSSSLSVRRAPISWPIASLERGSLGSGQVQTAPLTAFYPGTAWAAHGNYGVEYDLTIPLRNDTASSTTLQLALESPLKGDAAIGGLRFSTSPGKAVMFRGSVEVSGLDDERGRPRGRQGFHLVLRNGQQGPPLGTVTLAPGQQRQLQVRLIYPADATPPQVLTLLPVAPGAPLQSGEAVKQSGATPAVHP